MSKNKIVKSVLALGLACAASTSVAMAATSDDSCVKLSIKGGYVVANSNSTLTIDTATPNMFTIVDSSTTPAHSTTDIAAAFNAVNHDFAGGLNGPYVALRISGEASDTGAGLTPGASIGVSYASLKNKADSTNLSEIKNKVIGLDAAVQGSAELAPDTKFVVGIGAGVDRNDTKMTTLVTIDQGKLTTDGFSADGFKWDKNRYAVKGFGFASIEKGFEKSPFVVGIEYRGEKVRDQKSAETSGSYTYSGTTSGSEVVSFTGIQAKLANPLKHIFTASIGIKA